MRLGDARRAVVNETRQGHGQPWKQSNGSSVANVLTFPLNVAAFQTILAAFVVLSKATSDKSSYLLW